MTIPHIEVSLEELTDRINNMTDAELIEYSDIHITLDSGVLVEELVSRVRAKNAEIYHLEGRVNK